MNRNGNETEEMGANMSRGIGTLEVDVEVFKSIDHLDKSLANIMVETKNPKKQLGEVGYIPINDCKMHCNFGQ